MTKMRNISAQLNRLAIAYMILKIGTRSSIGGWDYAPDFIAWILFFNIVRNLKQERPKLELLERFSIVLGLWAMVEWQQFILLPNALKIAGVVIKVMGLYFHYLLLTEIAQLIYEYQEWLPADVDYGWKMRLLRAVVLLLETVAILAQILPIVITDEGFIFVLERMARMLQMLGLIGIIKLLFEVSSELKKADFSEHVDGR